MIKSQVETITPATAIEWLETVKSDDGSQRLLKQSHVDWLAKQITDGKWHLNGEPLIFDEEGRLRDGQHRLWAVVQAQKAVECLVVRGVGADTFITMDTGVARGGADVLHILGYKNVNTLNAALGWIHRCNVGGMMASAKAAGYTHEIGARMIEKHRGLADSVEWAIKIRNDVFLKHIPPACLAFLHYKFCMHDVGAAESFFAKVSAEQPCAINSGPASFRKWLSNTAATQSRTPKEIMAIAVKAWTAFLKGENVSHLSWRRIGEKPEGFPTFPGDEGSPGPAKRKRQA